MLTDVPAITLRGLPDVLMPDPGALSVTLELPLLNVVLPVIEMLPPPLVAMLKAPVPAVGAVAIVRFPALVKLYEAAAELPLLSVALPVLLMKTLLPTPLAAAEIVPAVAVVNGLTALVPMLPALVVKFKLALELRLPEAPVVILPVPLSLMVMAPPTTKALAMMLPPPVPF